MSRKTLTPKTFALFKETFKKWQVRLGLQEWTVSFKKQEMDDAEACIDSDPESRTALVTINSKPFHLNNNKDIEETALHEVLHLLIADLSHAAVDRYTDRETLVRVEEALVNRLTTLCQTLISLEK